MSTSNISTTSTRHFRLLAHAFLLISTNSLTLCLLYTLYISPSKQYLGHRSGLAVLRIAWLIASGLVLIGSLCYLISSYYQGHQHRMVATAMRHDVETGVREIGGERGERARGGGGGGGGEGRREETELIAGPAYELQLRPASVFTRALGLARGGRNPPSPTLLSGGGGMDAVREKERRHGPAYALQKPLPPNPPTDSGDEDEGEERGRAEHWQQDPAAAPPVASNWLRVPRNPPIRPGSVVYPGYSTGASAILPFGQAGVSSGGGAPGVRVGVQGRSANDDEDNGSGNDDDESLRSQPLYANNELREVIGRYL